ncbi:AAA family ATPase OS=Rhizobacter sp. AJA081-3 OX=2753607 GN=HZ992_19115 PE=4 SV=1 [Rhizobacter fulvus]
MNAGPTVQLTLIGSPTLTVDQTLHPLERRDAALLAYVVLNGPVPRVRVATLLWPGVKTQTAQTNLRQRLFRLKQRAGRDLVTPGLGLALHNQIKCDLTVAAREVMADELGLPRLLGSFTYEDCDELSVWLEQVRAQHHLDRLARISGAAERLENEGQVAQALVYAEAFVCAAPAEEHGHRRVMRLHYRRGDRAGALAAFDRCKDALFRELGERPSQETIELAELIASSSAMLRVEQTRSAVSTVRPPRLIGREHEWRALSEEWDRSRCILIIGEPGIGKSRLATEFAQTRSGALQVPALPGDHLTPYATASRILRYLGRPAFEAGSSWAREWLAHLVPEWAGAPQGTVGDLQMQRAFVATIGASSRDGAPRALVLDDAQYVDDASLTLLLAWMSEPNQARTLLTSRRDGVPPPIRAWLDDRDDAVYELELGPLRTEVLGEFVDSLRIEGVKSDQWAPILARRSGGNPLFVLELIRETLSRPDRDPTAAANASPAQVSRLLDRRLTRLSSEALSLAQVGALCGPDFDADLAAAVLECHPLGLTGPWRELEQAQVLVGETFAHDLVREAVLRTITSAIATAMHRRIAQQLESSSVGLPSARIADHFQRGEQWSEAARHFEEAGRASHRAARPLEALQYWDAASDCHRLAGDLPGAFQTRHEAIEPAIIALPHEVTAGRVQSLIEDARGEGERMQANLAHAKFTATAGDFASALTTSSEAVGIARRIGDRKLECAAVAVFGVCLTMTGQARQALEEFAAMATHLSQIGDHGVLSDFHSGHGHALSALGLTGEAVEAMLTAAQWAERSGDTDSVALNLGNAATCLGYLGRYTEAIAAAQRAHDLQSRLGQMQGEPFAVGLMNLGMFTLAEGRFVEALGYFERSLDSARRGAAGRLSTVIEGHLATAYLRLGQPARARQVLSPISDLPVPRILARRAILDWRIRSHSTAAAWTNLLDALSKHGEALVAIDLWGLELAIATAEPPEPALRRAKAVRDASVRANQPGVALSALFRMAAAEHRLGDLDSATRSARSCLEEREHAAPYDIEAPEFWWTTYRIFSEAGEREAAEATLQRGIEWVERSASHVSPPFLEAYLHRSRFVPQLRRAAREG